MEDESRGMRLVLAGVLTAIVVYFMLPGAPVPTEAMGVVP